MRAISIFPDSHLDGGEDVPTFKAAEGGGFRQKPPSRSLLSVAHWNSSPLCIRMPLIVALTGPHQHLLPEVLILSSLPISTRSDTTSASFLGSHNSQLPLPHPTGGWWAPGDFWPPTEIPQIFLKYHLSSPYSAPWLTQDLPTGLGILLWNIWEVRTKSHTRYFPIFLDFPCQPLPTHMPELSAHEGVKSFLSDLFVLFSHFSLSFVMGSSHSHFICLQKLWFTEVFSTSTAH